MPNVSIGSTLRARTERLPNPRTLSRIKNAILGNTYELSVTYIADRRSKTLNTRYRKENAPADVLSFPLSKHEGEIFLNVRKIEREARRQGAPFTDHCLRLFIHGCLHLKGYAHGVRMEREERRLLERFTA